MKKRMYILILAGILVWSQSGIPAIATDTLQSNSVPLTQQSDAQITSITATPEQLSSEGGQVTLTVNGNSLTAANWSVEVSTYLEGGIAWSKDPAAVSDITEDGAIITIPKNTMKNNKKFHVKVGILVDGEMVNPIETIIYQSGKSASTSVDPKSVSLNTDNVLTITFGEEITAKDLEAFKKNFYLSDLKTPTANHYDLTDSDMVSISGKTITIQLSNVYNATSLSAIHINEGALQNSQGVNLQTIDWLITSSVHVSSIDLSEEILDSNGGTVTATLIGTKLGALSEKDIEANVFLSGTSTSTDIPITITTGANPTLTYALPSNTTDQTQSYYLRVRVQGTPVYESTSENPAKAAVVSVMSEDTDTSAQTLSSMSVSGISTSDSDYDVTSLVLNAQTTSGGVKMTLRLAGTHLDPSIVKVRAIDENGIIWPVYHIAECDGSWRFLAVAHEHKNGAVGGGNTMLIEVLPAKYAGADKHYTVQVAIDGEHFLDSHTIDLTVLNAGLKDDADYRSCGKEDIKQVIVNHIDTDTKEAIADQDIYNGYAISMVQGFPIAAKELDGYTVVKSPEIDLENDWVENGREYTFEYKKIETPIDDKEYEPVTAPSFNYRNAEALGYTTTKVMIRAVEEDNPMPETTILNVTDSQTLSLGEIEFNKPGKYHYEIIFVKNDTEKIAYTYTYNVTETNEKLNVEWIID